MFLEVEGSDDLLAFPFVRTALEPGSLRD